MKNDLKRVAVYYIQKELYEYNVYLIKQLKEYINTLYIVVTDKIPSDQIDILKQYGNVIVCRAATSLDTYRYVLEHNQSEFTNYQQIICCDSYIFGPLYSLEKLFNNINICNSDIYALETRFTDLISSSFFVLKNANHLGQLFQVPTSQYWVKSDGLSISSFTHFSEQDNFYFLEIPKNIIQRQQPFLQQGFFWQYPEQWLAHSGGMQIKNVLDFIKTGTSYNEKMILDYWVKKQPMSILRQNLHLNYILPDNFSYLHNSKASVALILYIYYEDLIDYCYKYALSMPENADIYIITCKDEMIQACKKVFAKFPCHKIYFRQMENRGRDVAAYLVAARDVFEKYDYVCCMHDKKSPQYAKTTSEDFSYHLFECNLSSKEYVKNIIKTFDENPHIGMLVPPFVNFGKINTVGNSIATEAQGVKEQMTKLSLNVPFDSDVVAPLGTMFWVKGKAFLPIFKHSWVYEDFPSEPNKSTGTILHILERTYPFVIQEAGYFVGLVSPLTYSQIYHDTSYWLYKERQQQFYGLNGKKWPRIVTSITTSTNTVLHFKDVKKTIQEYIKQKRQRRKQRQRQIKNQKKYIGDAFLKYITVNKGRALIHILCGNDLYLQCGIYKYYPKKEISVSAQQLLEYYKKYNGIGFFVEIPVAKLKNHPIEAKKSEREFYKLNWGENLPYYGIYDFAKENLFFRLNNYQIYIEDKLHFYKNILLTSQYKLKEKLLFLLLKLNPIHKYVLFSENGGAGDNSFELFKYSVKPNSNCYYLASKDIINGIEDSNLKKHMIEFNSWKHFWMFLGSKKWITSFSLRLELFPQKKILKDIHYYNIPAEWIFVPHGITADKLSIMVCKYSWDEPERTFCSSPYEKDKLCQNYKFRNTFISGYPRMDKWYGAKLDDKKIVIFFTWRFNMCLFKKEELAKSLYVKTIIQIIEMIRKKFPTKRIYYVFHHEVVKNGLDKIIQKELVNMNISYIYLNSAEGIRDFNDLFKSAKYLITDYSSVAYDFAYKKNSIPIYYLDKDFISGHYPLENKFYDIHLGVLAHNEQELEKALKLEAPTKEMKERKNRFFKYLDNKNCERVYNAIFERSTND